MYRERDRNSARVRESVTPRWPLACWGVTSSVFIAHYMFLKSFCRSELTHKSSNLSWTISNIKKKLTDLYGNWLLQNEFENTLCEMSFEFRVSGLGAMFGFQVPALKKEGSEFMGVGVSSTAGTLSLSLSLLT
jgi:hypothetical protein